MTLLKNLCFHENVLPPYSLESLDLHLNTQPNCRWFLGEVWNGDLRVIFTYVLPTSGPLGFGVGFFVLFCFVAWFAFLSFPLNFRIVFEVQKSCMSGAESARTPRTSFPCGHPLTSLQCIRGGSGISTDRSSLAEVHTLFGLAPFISHKQKCC